MKDTKSSKKTAAKTEGDSHAGLIMGAGIAALAAVAGTYFLYGSKGAGKRRAQIKGWALKAKGEILEKLENLTEVNEEVYGKIVREITDRYQGLKQIDPTEIDNFRTELLTHWKNIRKGLEVAVKGKKRPATKSKSMASKKKAAGK